jgi:hypothetical protein
MLVGALIKDDPKDVCRRRAVSIARPRADVHDAEHHARSRHPDQYEGACVELSIVE